MPAAVILQIALAALPILNVGVTEFIAWLNTLKASIQATGEWTPEQEEDFRAALFAKTSDPAYQPDTA